MRVKPLMLVCDDHPVRVERWVKRLEQMPGAARFEIKPVTGQSLATAVDALDQRREAAREGGLASLPDAAADFDAASLVLIDYDLTPEPGPLDDTEAADQMVSDKVRAKLRGRSAEQVAYLARCYSAVGLLVIVNQRFREATFDVTLQRFAQSYGDLNLTQADIDNPALWSSTAADGSFRPWSWPVLSDADAMWEARIAETNLEASVLGALGLSEENFSARQLDLLGEVAASPDSSLGDVTFDALVGSSLGLDIKDEQPEREQRRRIAAWVVSRWLEQIVLPGQNVVADLPHLASRFPALVGEGDGWATASQKILTANEYPAVLSSVPCKFKPFLSRAAWPVSEARQVVSGLSEPSEWPDLVFCEDTSRFIPLDDAKEVETDVPGPYTRRFIEHVPEVRYDPFKRVL